jgi:5'-nucleotidase
VTLATLNADSVLYVDYVVAGRALASQLRAQGAELIIALTHMRVPNDTRLSEQVQKQLLPCTRADTRAGTETATAMHKG